jgi:hypothetical protein
MSRGRRYHAVMLALNACAAVAGLLALAGVIR